MGTIRFYLHDKVDKKGKRPINLIYSIQGQRKVFRTPLKLYEANWDLPNQKALYIDKKQAKQFYQKQQQVNPTTRLIDYDLLLTAKEAEEHNTDLAACRKQVADIEKCFEMDKVIYSSQMVIDKLREIKGSSPLTKREEKSDVIITYIEKWLEDHSATRARGSMTVYKSLRAHLAAIINEKKLHITFENIDHQFLQAFQNFLIERRGLSNNTAAKQLSVLKSFLGYARRDGHKVSDNYRDFKMKQDSLEVIALTQQEFLAMWELDLSNNKKYDQVRDVFLFGCSTGLRFSDLAALKREHIFHNEIRLTIQKTREVLTIPLNAFSSAILTKYKGMLRPLPVISNQKTNAYLTGYSKKEKSGNIIKHVGIAERAGINTPTELVRFKGAIRQVQTFAKYELVTSHIARKTYISLSLEKGIQAEVVMSLSGHKSYNSFKRYVSITDARKHAVVQQAWGEIPKAELKIV